MICARCAHIRPALGDSWLADLNLQEVQLPSSSSPGSNERSHMKLPAHPSFAGVQVVMVQVAHTGEHKCSALSAGHRPLTQLCCRARAQAQGTGQEHNSGELLAVAMLQLQVLWAVIKSGYVVCAT